MNATCDKCGEEFTSNESVAPCPQCGEIQRIAKQRVTKSKSKNAHPSTPVAWIVTIALIAVGVWVVWWLPGSTTTEATNPEFEFVAGPTPHHAQYVHSITGTIQNNGPALNYIQIEFALYMGSSRVGTAMDNLTSMKAGEEWQFDAIALEPFDRFEQIGITSY